MNVQELGAAVCASRGFAHKRDIADVVRALQSDSAIEHLCAVPLGDDCAAIADGTGHLLFAIEGFVDDFVEASPWFAGYCGVMVNVSDIYAMGGRPLAIVDALWSHGAEAAAELLNGLRTAARRYGVPIVGGHTNCRGEHVQLAVAVLGRAERLLTSFGARSGDDLLMVVDLRGCYQDPYPYWNASTTAEESALRADLELLPCLAEEGLCDTAKDISMAGTLGTILMMLECSKVGATIDIDRMPRPATAGSNADLVRWLTAFPSYGFVLSVRPESTEEVQHRFRSRDLAIAVIGKITLGRQAVISWQGESGVLWDLATTPFMLPTTR